MLHTYCKLAASMQQASGWLARRLAACVQQASFLLTCFTLAASLLLALCLLASSELLACFMLACC